VKAFKTPSVTLSDQVTKVYEIIAGYHTTHLIEIGRDLGVWEHLSRNPGSTSADTAAALGLVEFYVDVLCRTAHSAELVDRLDGGWQMAPHMDILLGSPGHTFDFSRTARVHMVLGEDYALYPDSFRGGSSMSYQDHDPRFMEEVAAALRPVPSIFLEAVLPLLPELAAVLDRADRIVDIGCGGGWALAAFADAYPDASMVGVDVEPVSVDIARRLVADRGLSERCSVVLADASGFAAEDPFDLATMFLVYHEISPEAKRDVLRSVFDSLKPGGTLLMFDEVYPVSGEQLRSMPMRFAALAQWYELIWGNVIGTRMDVLEDLDEVGFEVTSELDFSRFHIFVAQRSV